MLFCAGKIPARIMFTNTAADGLPTSEVISLAKDEKGFMVRHICRCKPFWRRNFSRVWPMAAKSGMNCIKITRGACWWAPLPVCSAKTGPLYKNQQNNHPQAVNDILLAADNKLYLATASGPVKPRHRPGGHHRDKKNHTPGFWYHSGKTTARCRKKYPAL